MRRTKQTPDEIADDIIAHWAKPFTVTAENVERGSILPAGEYQGEIFYSTISSLCKSANNKAAFSAVCDKLTAAHFWVHS